MPTMESLLKHLVDAEGSDLHILSGLAPACRIHGKLQPVEGTEALSPAEVQALVYSVLTQQQIDKFENDPESRNELDFAFGLSGVGRFRFNVHRQRGTIGAVVRALSSQIPTLEDLGVPPALWKICDVKKGLFLVTGPTGSGKSTTLAAIIDRLNETRAEHILTIEDPIEYIHNSKKAYVTQREVGEAGDTLSFTNALKYALRQDPDVILVGEMRDYETIGIAVTSAETGHLVLGTLHTSSAAQTVGRIIDVFPTDQQPQIVVQLAQNLVGVASQILLPRSDSSGRVLCLELMKVNGAIRSNIRGNNIDAIYQSMQTGSKEGMLTMDQSLLDLIEAGKITYDIAKPHVRDDITHRRMQELAGKGGNGAPSPPPQPSAQVTTEQESPASSRGKVSIPPWEQP
jgi:twitching motility protein PilT